MISRPGWWPALRAMLFAAVLTVLLFQLLTLSSHWLARDLRWISDRAYLKLFWVLALILVFEHDFRKLGMRWPWPGTWIIGVLVPVATALLVYEAAGLYMGWNGRTAFHYFCTVTAEELFFTGFILLRLRVLGTLGSAGMTALLFMLIHFPTQFAGFWEGRMTLDDFLNAAILFSSGFFSAGVRLFTGSLLPCIGLHFLMDYMQEFSSSWGSPFFAYPPTPLDGRLWSLGLILLFLTDGGLLLLFSKRRGR